MGPGVVGHLSMLTLVRSAGSGGFWFLLRQEGGIPVHWCVPASSGSKDLACCLNVFMGVSSLPGHHPHKWSPSCLAPGTPLVETAAQGPCTCSVPSVSYSLGACVLNHAALNILRWVAALGSKTGRPRARTLRQELILSCL